MPYINNRGCRIYYETHGQGDPLVCLHGYGNCVQDWHSLGYVDLLAPFLKLILIDGRGFGRSDKPHDQASYHYDLLCNDTLMILDALQLETANLFGYSMGGRNAFSLMAYYPQRFKRFIIGGMHPYGCEQSYGDFLRDKLNQGMNEFMAYFESGFERFPESIRQRYVNENDPTAMIAAYANGWPDLSMKLANIQQPTLLYIGKHDQFRTQVEQAANLFRHGKLELLPNVGHGCAFWQPEAACELIKGFISDK